MTSASTPSLTVLAIKPIEEFSLHRASLMIVRRRSRSASSSMRCETPIWLPSGISTA